MKGLVESFEILGGLPIVRWKVVVCDRDLESFGFPCFLKADVVGHKTEMGAVLKCNNLGEAVENFRKMKKKFGESRIVVQEFFEGIEMILGLKSDEVFGKLLVVGFGGVFAEVKRDVSFRALPVSRSDIRDMVRDLDGFEVFGARGGNYDLEKFYDLIEKFAKLCEKIRAAEVDLNPVIVGEKKSFIVDARVEVS